MGFVHIACVFVHVCPKNDYDDECCWRMVWNVLQKALQVSLRSHRRCVVISMLGAAGEEKGPRLLIRCSGLCLFVNITDNFEKLPHIKAEVIWIPPETKG